MLDDWLLLWVWIAVRRTRCNFLSFDPFVMHIFETPPAKRFALRDLLWRTMDIWGKKYPNRELLCEMLMTMMGIFWCNLLFALSKKQALPDNSVVCLGHFWNTDAVCLCKQITWCIAPCRSLLHTKHTKNVICVCYFARYRCVSSFLIILSKPKSSVDTNYACDLGFI
jgi:hypothetical protein